MLYREIIAVCSQIHTKHINTLCGQNTEFVSVKPGGKVHPRTSHEGPEGAVVYLYSFFNLGARCRWVVNATPGKLYHRERPGTHCCIGGWVGPQGRSGQVREISPPHRDSISGPPSS